MNSTISASLRSADLISIRAVRGGWASYLEIALRFGLIEHAVLQQEPFHGRYGVDIQPFAVVTELERDTLSGHESDLEIIIRHDALLAREQAIDPSSRRVLHFELEPQSECVSVLTKPPAAFGRMGYTGAKVE